jgi:hypothetical protein
MKLHSSISALIAGAVLLFSSCCKEPSRPAVSDASSLHKWLSAYALDSGGKFPDDLSQLLKKSYGTDERVFPNVIEYRGKGMSTSDRADLVLFRYKVGGGREARVTVSGSAKTVPSTEPLPDKQ